MGRLYNRLYVFAVCLLGIACLYEYYAFCFSNLIGALTARSLVLTSNIVNVTAMIETNTNRTTFSVDEETIHRLNSTEDSRARRALMAKLLKEIRAEVARDEKNPSQSENKRDRYQRNQEEMTSDKELQQLRKEAQKEIDDNLQRQIKELQKLANERKAGLDNDLESRRQAEFSLLASVKEQRRLLEHMRKSTEKYSTRFTPIVIRDLIWFTITTFVAGMMIWSYVVAVTTSPGVLPNCFSKQHHVAHIRGASTSNGEQVGLLSSGSGSSLSTSNPIPRVRMELSTGGKLPHCAKCDTYKPPRTHHCSHCNMCVLRYDHHCYWIGQCVGYFNYKPFLCFLVWTTLFCQIACATLSKGVYYYFANLAKHNTGAVQPVHILSDHTARYILESPSLFSSSEVDVSDAPPFTVLICFVFLFAAGLRAGTILQDHITLAFQNKTTLEDMAYQLDFPPEFDDSFQLQLQLRSNCERIVVFLQRLLCCRGSDATLRWRSPYDLGVRYNLEEIFGDADGTRCCCCAAPAICRWVVRLMPTLAFPRQTKEELASEDYFAMIDKLRQRNSITTPSADSSIPFPPVTTTTYGSIVFEPLPTATQEYDALLREFESSNKGEANFLLCPRGTHFRVMRSARRALHRQCIIAFHGVEALGADSDGELDDFESDIDEDDIREIRFMPRNHSGTIVLPGGKVVEEEMVRIIFTLSPNVSSSSNTPNVASPPAPPSQPRIKRGSSNVNVMALTSSSTVPSRSASGGSKGRGRRGRSSSKTR